MLSAGSTTSLGAVAGPVVIFSTFVKRCCQQAFVGSSTLWQNAPIRRKFFGSFCALSSELYLVSDEFFEQPAVRVGLSQPDCPRNFCGLCGPP